MEKVNTENNEQNETNKCQCSCCECPDDTDCPLRELGRILFGEQNDET